MNWRVIITDSESLTGVAPVCESKEHAKNAAKSGMEEGAGADWVFDCCPYPQIETWSEVKATLIAEVLTLAEAEICS